MCKFLLDNYIKNLNTYFFLYTVQLYVLVTDRKGYNLRSKTVYYILEFLVADHTLSVKYTLLLVLANAHCALLILYVLLHFRPSHAVFLFCLAVTVKVNFQRGLLMVLCRLDVHHSLC